MCVVSKRILCLQETCQMVNTHDDEDFSFCRSPSPNLRPANQSTPANQPLPSTPPYITSLKEWMTAQFEELHGKIDACATAIEELRTVVTKKKAKKVDVFFLICNLSPVDF